MILRSIFSTKLSNQSHSLESFPVNLYWRSLPLPCVSSHYCFTFLAKPFCTSNFSAVTTLEMMLSLGMSENFLQLSVIFDFASASFKTSLKKYCHALFVTCKGCSTWAWLINWPIKGTNFCRLFSTSYEFSYCCKIAFP